MKKKNLQPDLETLMPLLISQWRKFRNIPGPDSVLQTREFRGVVKSIITLKKNFDLISKEPADDYFAHPHILGAYLIYFWAVHYQEALSLISELPKSPERVLDVCSGPAPFAFAALRNEASEVIAVDRSLPALTLGAEVCGRYGLPLTIRRWDCHRGPCPVEGKFDLIMVGHALEELFPNTVKGWQDAQHQFIRYLLTLLTPDGHLILSESSQLQSNRRLLTLRDTLVKEGVPVQAPCVWKGECPALKTKDSPCYAQREFERPFVIKEIQRAADIHLSSLKMSYLILRHPEAGWPTIGDKRLYRVTSPPIEGHHGDQYYLCGVDGKKRLGTRLDKLPQEAKAYEYLKRGELIEIAGAQEEGYDMNVVEGTQLHVEAACGKPLKED